MFEEFFTSENHIFYFDILLFPVSPLQRIQMCGAFFRGYEKLWKNGVIYI